MKDGHALLSGDYAMDSNDVLLEDLCPLGSQDVMTAVGSRGVMTVAHIRLYGSCGFNFCLNEGAL